MPASVAQQAWTLTRKNFTLMRRQGRQTCREVLVPLFMLGAIVLLTSAAKMSAVPEKRVGEALRVYDPRTYFGDAAVVGFAPCIALGSPARLVAAAFEESTGVLTQCFACSDGTHCADGSESLRAARSRLEGDFAAGVIFNDESLVSSVSQKNGVEYTILMDGEVNPLAGVRNVTRWWYSGEDITALRWIPFVSLQREVDAAVSCVLTGNDRFCPGDSQFIVDLTVRAFPFPASTPRKAEEAVAQVVPLYLLIIMISQVRILLMQILAEKQAKLKQVMQMMGVRSSSYWLSWLMTAMVKSGTVVIAVVAVLKKGGVFAYTDTILLLCFFLLFSAATIAYVFCVSAIFSKSRIGSVVGSQGYLLLAGPGAAIAFTSGTSATVKAWSCLAAPSALFYGVNLISAAESAGGGVLWGNMNQAVGDDDISFATVMTLLALDVLLYTFLAAWLDKVMPGEFGAAEKPWFCLRRSYWCPPSVPSSTEVHAEGRGIAVAVMNITKTFATTSGSRGEKTRALDGVSFDLHEGEVTALLGPNGVGKSTLCGALSGLFGVSSGDARVYGRSVVSQMDSVRDLIGVCPQDERHWPLLSVSETLHLICALKGIPRAQASDSVVQILADVGLTQKAHDLVKTLSGGQKRRLSVSMALVGGSRLLLLDEPTSGIDVAERHKIWSLIERYKEGRCILLTTHSMQEADWLSHRIIVMSRGRVQVQGTSLELKRSWGLGYHLRIALDDAASQDNAALDSLVRRHVSSARRLGSPSGTATASERAELGAATPSGSFGSTVTNVEQSGVVAFALPVDTTPHFAGLLEELDERKAELGIEGHGISMTSLEDVYLRLAQHADEEAESQAAHSVDAATAAAASGRRLAERPSVRTRFAGRHDSSHDSDVSDDDDVTGMDDVAIEMTRMLPSRAARSESSAPSSVFAAAGRDSVKPSWWRQTMAVLRRRLTSLRRDKRTLWVQCGVPLVFVALTSVMSRSTKTELGMLAAHTEKLSLTSAQYAADPLLSGTQPMTLVYSTDGTSSGNVVNFFPDETQLHGMPVIAPVQLRSASPATVLNDYIWDNEYTFGGLAFSDSDFALEIFLNTSLTNSLPILVSLLDGAAFKLATSDSQPHSAAAAVAATTVPLSPSYAAFADDGGVDVVAVTSAGVSGLYLALGFAAMTSMYSLTLVKEKENKSRPLQRIMGIRSSAYYAGMWAADLVVFLIPWAGAAVLIPVLTDSFLGFSNVAALVVLLGAFGLVAPGPAYSLSFLFSDAKAAQTYTSLLNTVLVVILFGASIGFDTAARAEGQDSDNTSIATALDYVAHVYPPVALARGVYDTAIAAFAACTSPSGCGAVNAWTWELCGRPIVLLIASAPVWFAAVVWQDNYWLPSGAKLRHPPPDISNEDSTEDEDVKRERARVLSGDAQRAGDVVTTLRLRKTYYKPKPVVAVQDLSMSCKEGECFGLLGPNGGGKSSTLALLTAQISPQFGTASIGRHDVFDTRAREAAHSLTGFCPQENALFPLLTARETLRFYGSAKGIPPHKLTDYVDEAIDAVGLQPHANKIVKEYSGGTKRRLCLALAFVGSPRVVLLDEPTTGVDVSARRKVWRLLQGALAGRSILLTTHQLEEAELLCNRVGILVNGRLRCLGSVQHLKNKYRSGLKFEARLAAPGGEEAVVAALRELCPAGSDPKLTEAHDVRMRVDLPDGCHAAAVFRALEAKKEELGIADYALSQPTLEQVFIDLTCDQRDPVV